MSLQKAVANALSFAHLSGIGRGKASKASAEEDDEKKDAKAEGDDDEKKDDFKDSESAEDDAPDAKAEDDKPAKEDEGEKSSKAKAEDDDEDKDEEMRGNSAAAQARGREQRRCAAIFASPAAARNPVLAANLAFKTRMTRAEALATLEGTPAPAAAGHANRAARNPNVGSDGGNKPTPQQAAAARWDQHLQAAAKSGRR